MLILTFIIVLCSHTVCGNWKVFGGDTSHTGFVNITLNISVVDIKWQNEHLSDLLTYATINNHQYITIADDINLFVLDSQTGQLLRSMFVGGGDFGTPIFWFGNILIQNWSKDMYLDA
eukprot:260635_1